MFEISKQKRTAVAVFTNVHCSRRGSSAHKQHTKTAARTEDTSRIHKHYQGAFFFSVYRICGENCSINARFPRCQRWSGSREKKSNPRRFFSVLLDSVVSSPAHRRKNFPVVKNIFFRMLCLLSFQCVELCWCCVKKLNVKGKYFAAAFPFPPRARTMKSLLSCVVQLYLSLCSMAIFLYICIYDEVFPTSIYPSVQAMDWHNSICVCKTDDDSTAERKKRREKQLKKHKKYVKCASVQFVSMFPWVQMCFE